MASASDLPAKQYVLGCASPVLKGMLQDCGKEGRELKVCVGGECGKEGRELRCVCVWRGGSTNIPETASQWVGLSRI